MQNWPLKRILLHQQIQEQCTPYLFCKSLFTDRHHDLYKENLTSANFLSDASIKLGMQTSSCKYEGEPTKTAQSEWVCCQYKDGSLSQVLLYSMMTSIGFLLETWVVGLPSSQSNLCIPQLINSNNGLL